ncbi:MAG: ABC transporter ATP-binding protein [Pseudobdellovibrio sp.]
MLKLENISFQYGMREVLRNINLQISDGEIVALLGPSGCGKSTLLHLISGLLRPTQGRILHDNLEITGPSHQRVVIFQEHQLFPWKTVRENIEFALKAQNQDLKKADYFLELVQMQKYSKLYPRELSGGMKQRVGIARALAADPDILLLDEPFASLDPLVRHDIIRDILALFKKLNKTMLLVTHNTEEALFVGEKVYLFSTGPAEIREEIKIELRKENLLSDLKKDPLYWNYESRIHKHFESLRSSTKEPPL